MRVLLHDCGGFVPLVVVLLCVNVDQHAQLGKELTSFMLLYRGGRHGKVDQQRVELNRRGFFFLW